MFNKTIVNHPRDNYIPYDKTIIEKKAPTDESIRLLNEFQKESSLNIIRHVSVKDNSFNIEILRTSHLHSLSQLVSYKFSINGSITEGSFDINREEAMNFDLANKIFESIRDKIVHAFTEKLTT